MIFSKDNYSDCTKNYDLDLQSKILEEHSVENVYIVTSDQEGKDETSPLVSLSLLGKSGKFISTLVFLGTLKCATGNESSMGWRVLKSSICALLYISECFNDANSKGETVPTISANAIISSVLSKAGIYANTGNNKVSTLESIYSKENMDKFFYISDYIGSMCRSLIFNRTDNVLEKLSGNSIDDYNLLRFLGQIEYPSSHDVASYPYNNHAVVSNVSRTIFTHIMYSYRRAKILRYGNYCPKINNYMTFNNRAADYKGIVAEKTANTELVVVVVAFTALGFLLFSLYAMYDFAKRKRHSRAKRKPPLFVQTNYKDSSLKRTPNIVCVTGSSNVARYRYQN
ncbi:hypothetical protein [Candidatus Ichthyocystis sparus]|uniref:hypothetical protein n=1 Tax=Candidatus Ichthyocystis sparus TaxID=1561004 RepID=UPI000B821EF3|nr:hypothetical protein [Candidatus Ichthyocystis sparus]